MPTFVNTVVSRVISERKGLQRISTDQGNAYVLTDVLVPAEVGDQVVLNTTAVDLQLGSGGWHVVHWNLSRDSSTKSAGHIIKGRYLSEQLGVETLEEYEDPGSGYLAGMPVVVCELHSQLAPVAAGIATMDPELSIAYIMDDTAALPYALSDTAAYLFDTEVITNTISCGQAFGAEQEAVNVASALAWAAQNVDVAIVAPGIGVAGTGSELGFSSVAAASHLDLVAALDGNPIFALRYSDADVRPRHQGVSHHGLTILKLAHSTPDVALPTVDGYPVTTDISWPEEDGKIITDITVTDPEAILASFFAGDDAPPITVMGRGPSEDPNFFRFAIAAGIHAASLFEPEESQS